MEEGGDREGGRRGQVEGGGGGDREGGRRGQGGRREVEVSGGDRWRFELFL